MKSNLIEQLNLNLEISTKEEQEFLDNTLGDFNLTQVPSKQKELVVPLSYCIKKNDQIIAGITADMYMWNILFIEILYADESFRQHKLGSFLMDKVEEEAKALGAKLSHTDTFDFQAKDFYLKRGYEVFGILDDCPEGHQRFYLKKVLS